MPAENQPWAYSLRDHYKSLLELAEQEHLASDLTIIVKHRDTDKQICEMHSYLGLVQVRCPSIAREAYQTGPRSESGQRPPAHSLVLLLKSKLSAMFLLEYLYTDEISFGKDESLEAILDLVLFGLGHSLLDLTRLCLTYLVTRAMSVETVALLTSFIAEISGKSSGCKETASLLQNSLKACKLFLTQNWRYFKQTIFFE